MRKDIFMYDDKIDAKQNRSKGNCKVFRVYVVTLQMITYQETKQ